MQKLPKFHIPEAFKSQAVLKPNPHATHNFDNPNTNILEISRDGTTRHINAIEEVLMRHHKTLPDLEALKVRQNKPNAKFAVSRILVGSELWSVLVYNIQPDGTYIYNSHLSDQLNRVHGYKSSIQSLLLTSILSQAIILES